MDMLVLTWPFCTMSIKNKYMHPLTKICHIWKYSSRRMPNVKHELLSIAWVPEFHLFFCKVRVAQFCFLCIALHICFPFLSFFFSFGHCIAFPSSSIYDSDYPFGILDLRLWLPFWYLQTFLLLENQKTKTSQNKKQQKQKNKKTISFLNSD
jgi:hypothetical protein